MRKKYYHRTIVVKDVFSAMPVYLGVLIAVIAVAMGIFMKYNIKPHDGYVTRSIRRILCMETGEFIKPKNIYDIFSDIVPLVKSSDEMMKKYEAFYGGVKKEKREELLKEIPRGFLEGKKSEEKDMSKPGILFNNATTYPINLQEIKSIPLEFSNPTVLIVHTHTSEAYADSSGARSLDDSQNVVRIGEIITKKLRENGINVIHDTTQNDYPAYNGSYNKAMGVIQRNIAENPDIQIVLDIHRDYTARTENGTETQIRPVGVVNGKKTAQVMIVAGTDHSGLVHPEWRKNLAFAVAINEELDKISENIARPINIRKERFNQHLTQGSLILEVGSASNYLSESENAADYIADALMAVLNKK